ncbi:MAG: hypothetical protein IKQ61_11035 [Spirochaetales bacterium]|nr:hypothetical protein [Spirochaetales bacterium]
MKKIISTILTVLCMTAMVCCSNESVIMGNESTTTTTIATTINANTLALGKVIANAKLQEAVMNGNTSWTEQTEISDYYPIYTAGIDGVSHIEFKLTTNGEDAGYILASVTDNDILVPECSDNAKSTTEIYRDALSRTDFNVYRYNWFESAAESADNGRGGVTVLASIGFDGGDIRVHNGGRGEDREFDNEYAQKKAAYAAKLKENKCLPYYDKTDLERYYEQQTAAGRGEVEHTVYEYEKLSHYIGTDKNGNKYYLPNWNQPFIADNMLRNQPMGCGPVAWAMVYAYWSVCKGKTNLFPADIGENELYFNEEPCYSSYEFKDKTSKIVYTGMIWNVMKAIHDDTGTTHSLVEHTSFGLTMPLDMPKGMQYAKKKGYSFNVSTECNAMIYNNIYNEICADRPVIIYMDAWNFNGNKTSLHYTVAYGAGRKIYKSTNVVTEFWMDLNMGWNGKCRQVYCISEYYDDKPWKDQDGAMSSCFNYYQVNLR